MRAILALLVGIALLSACGLRAPARRPEPAPPAPESDLVRSLIELGDDALARGDFADAESRYARALDAQPQSTRARVGLGRVALGRDLDGEAEDHFRKALARASTANRAEVSAAPTSESPKSSISHRTKYAAQQLSRRLMMWCGSASLSRDPGSRLCVRA